LARGKAKWTDEEALEAVTRSVDPDAQQPDRLEWERKNFRNLAYLSGIQHFSQDPVSGRLHPLQDIKGRKRVDFTANLVLPTVVRSVAKIGNLKGGFTVAPNSGERKDREASKIAEKFFDYIRASEDFKAKKYKALMWAANTGLGVLKICWNPDAGEPERVYLMSEEEKLAEGITAPGKVAANPGLSDQVKQMKDQEGLFEDVPVGDVEVSVVSPYAFYWDSDAKDGGLRDCTWCATKTLMSVDKVENLWGVKIEKSVPKADTWVSHNTLYEEAISYFHGGQAAIGRTVPGRDRMQHERVVVVEYFQRPLKENNYKGRYVVVAGDKVLANKENPYARVGKEFSLPFVTFPWLPRPGGFVSIDLTSNLTEPQRAYNESNQHMQDVERHQGYPILVTWKGAGIKSHRVPNYPGPVLELNPTFGPPVQIPPAPLPQYVYANVENRRREMQEIASQADVGRGAAPGQVRGSQAIGMLLNEDNQILNLIAEAHFDALAQCGRLMLALAGQFYDQRRIIKLLGEDAHWDVMSFIGADLRGNYDVRVTGETARVDSGKVRQAVVMELVSAGFLNPSDPTDKQLVMDTMYLRLPDQPFEDMLIDKRNAERENERLIDVAQIIAQSGPEAVPAMMAEMPIARDFEDHRAHLEEHDKLRKSREYMELPPNAQQMIDAHVAQHQQFASQAMQQQLELQMLMTQNGGQPAPKGEASQPKRGK
jgi:hypothetical protein